MKRILRVGGSFLAGILVLILVTLRFTGLEPEYLDLKELRARGMIARPGLWLRGDVVTTPVTDWSWVDQRPHPGREFNTIMVETRTPYLIPHSVTTNVLPKGRELYIYSNQNVRLHIPFPRDKSWTHNVARDPRVRIKIDDRLYEVTLVLISDRAEAAAILGRDPETRLKGHDGQERTTNYTHLYRVYQRNVTEYGNGNKPRERAQADVRSLTVVSDV